MTIVGAVGNGTWATMTACAGESGDGAAGCAGGDDREDTTEAWVVSIMKDVARSSIFTGAASVLTTTEQGQIPLHQ